MTDVINSIRGLRHSGQFEPCMSAITVAIGDVERLGALDVAQLERLNAAADRLNNAIACRLAIEERRGNRG